ncbi:MAG: ABC transporter substrate-binding protein, partial [Isosphaeraceae bacterium]|nr:ABC transporter substrate-binding protein [Isosphaeraceae bacterium]
PVPDTPHRITVLRLGGESDLEEVPASSLKEGMKLFQFTEGAYYRLETIDLGGDPDSAPSKLEEAVRGGSDLVVITHPLVLRAVATREVGRPLVFGILGDPRVLGAGEAEERHRPGLTGAYNPLPASRLLTLVRYYRPGAKRVGVAFDSGEPLSVAHKDALIRESARAGFEVVAVDAGGGDDPSAAIEGLLNEPLDAICLVAGLGASTSMLIERAARAKVPVFGYREDQVRKGALAAEVPKVDRVGLEAGRMAYRVLGGETPGGIPLERINDTEPVVNLKVAEALGIELPTGALRISRAIGGGPSAPTD